MWRWFTVANVKLRYLFSGNFRCMAEVVHKLFTGMFNFGDRMVVQCSCEVLQDIAHLFRRNWNNELLAALLEFAVPAKQFSFKPACSLSLIDHKHWALKHEGTLVSDARNIAEQHMSLG